jgi:hypothetical protein
MSAYILPRPCASEDDDARFDHRDLASMTPLQLWSEDLAARLALTELVRSGTDSIIVHGTGEIISASDWLRQRIARIEGRQS